MTAEADRSGESADRQSEVEPENVRPCFGCGVLTKPALVDPGLTTQHWCQECYFNIESVFWNESRFGRVDDWAAPHRKPIFGGRASYRRSHRRKWS